MVFSLHIEHETDLDTITGALLMMAGEMGFAKLDANLMAMALSEIATNALRYASKGTVTIRPTENSRGLEIVVRDEGPGIASVANALKDGFSTQPTSLGIGLGAAQRSVHEMEVNSTPNSGTTVILRHYLPLNKEVFDVGGISLRDPLYAVNGDEFFWYGIEGDKLFLAVIDGLGEGETAAKSAAIVRQSLQRSRKARLMIQLEEAEVALRNSGHDSAGAAVGLALVSERMLRYSGIGDTFIRIYTLDGVEPLHFSSVPGVVGMRHQGKVEEYSAKLDDYAQLVIVLCTDGIHDRFAPQELPLTESSQVIAEIVMDRYRRSYGDATVLVAKLKRS